MSKTTQGRLAYADLLRVLAAIAVIVLHISTSCLPQAAVGSTSWTAMVVYDSLVRWCVPMFVMLSGAFLLDPKKSVRGRDLFLKYILRVLVALAVYGTFYALVGLFKGTFSLGLIRDALGYVLRTQTRYHLWFLYMMIGLYLVTPVLRAFVRGASRATFHWFFLLVLVFCSLLPTLWSFFPDQMAIPTEWLNKFDVQLVMGYVGYYVAGYYLKNFTLNRLAEFIIYILGILGAVATVWVSLSMGTAANTLMNYTAPTVAFMAVAVFVLFRYVLGVSEERSRRQRLVGVAKISFGIYLIHDFFITVLAHFGITVMSFNPIISIPVLSAIVFLCSFVVAWLLSKLPLIGRYLT